MVTGAKRGPLASSWPLRISHGHAKHFFGKMTGDSLLFCYLKKEPQSFLQYLFGTAFHHIVLQFHTKVLQDKLSSMKYIRSSRVCSIQIINSLRIITVMIIDNQTEGNDAKTV